MIPLFALAILFALFVANAAERSARAAEQRDGDGPLKSKPGTRAIDPVRFAAAVKEEVASQRDPAKLDAIAKKLDDAGHPLAANVARQRSTELRHGRTTPASAETAFPPPFAGVTAEAWNRYVRLMATAKPDTVSPSNQLGLFQIGFPRLADLGYVENLHKGQKDGRAVWIADFRPPASLAAFLADPVTQYVAFVETTKVDRQAVIKRHADAIGKTVAGTAATLSGLLAVAYNAGLVGLDRWLSSPDARSKTPRTTAAYQRANGLF
jgi:hypothetical protein